MALRTTLITMTLPLLGSACQVISVRENPDHCTYNEGDRYCAELDPDRPYCTQGDDECRLGGFTGCVAEVAPECHAPCGTLSDAECMGGSSSGTDTGSGSESGSESGSSGGSESSTTGPMPCVGNEDCPDAAAPFCEPVSGECVTCDVFGAEGDAACAGLDPTNPVCLDGACVQCTAEAPEACTGMTPVCDDATKTCVPCNAHDQCGEAACNLFTGACLPADAVVHVGGAMPDFATITDAVASFDMMTEGTIIVHAGGSYDEDVLVDGGRVLAFLAADLGPMVTPPQWVQTSGDMPQLTVGDATVLMDGLRLSGNQSAMVPGLRADGGRAWVDRSRIVQNTGGGIVAQNGAELVLRNCFLGDGTNGDNALTVDGTMAMSSAAVAYTTLGVGVDNFNDVFPVFCDGAVDVAIRNSLLVSFDNPMELSCPMATVTNTASEALIPGAGNVALGNVGPDWFVDIDTGNFHLNNSPATLAMTARWQAGDPPTDIEGDSRPTVDDTPDYAGADVP